MSFGTGMDKTIWLVIGVGVPVAVIIAIFAILNSIEKSNNANDVFNQDQLLKGLDSGKITILEYCEHKISDKQQQLCTEYKNRFGIK